MITVKLYGDESADETKSRVFAIANVLGTQEDWLEGMREWLRRTRGLPFHANKCESQYAKHSKNPDAVKHRENLKLYEDLTKILISSRLTGISVALDLRSQQEILPGIPTDIGYYKCFTDLIVNVAQMVRDFNAEPSEPDDARLELTFDSRRESNGTAGTIYTMFRTLPEWADTSVFDTNVTFDDGQEDRLEMADLLAREAMKEFDRKITMARPDPRKSFLALDAAGKFIWIERDRAYCERWRDQVNSDQGKADLEDYKKWLVETRRVQNGRPHDNMTNRALFYAWVEKRDALAKRPASGAPP